jgi:hypothetical protein
MRWHANIYLIVSTYWNLPFQMIFLNFNRKENLNKYAYMSALISCSFRVTGVWTVVLCSLCRYCTTWAAPPALFALGYFQTGSHSSAKAGLELWSSYLCLRIARTRDVNHNAQLIGCDGISLTFCSGWPWTRVLPIITSPVAGKTGMSHDSQFS